jgi:hypothetical protein
MEGRGRICKQLLDEFKETIWQCKLKKEAVDHTVWRIRFGRGYVPVVRLSKERRSEIF